MSVSAQNMARVRIYSQRPRISIDVIPSRWCGSDVIHGAPQEAASRSIQFNSTHKEPASAGFLFAFERRR